MYSGVIVIGPLVAPTFGSTEALLEARARTERSNGQFDF